MSWFLGLLVSWFQKASMFRDSILNKKQSFKASKLQSFIFDNFQLLNYKCSEGVGHATNFKCFQFSNVPTILMETIWDVPWMIWSVLVPPKKIRLVLGVMVKSARSKSHKNEGFVISPIMNPGSF